MSELLNEETTTYVHIENTCREHGISVSELCRRANIDRQLMNSWKQGDPKSIKQLKSINVELEKLKKTNNPEFVENDAIVECVIDLKECKKTGTNCEFKCTTDQCKLID